MKPEPMPPLSHARQAWPLVRCPPYKRDRLTVAYHEAGHAVLCATFSLPFIGVSVFVDDSTAEQPADTIAGAVRLAEYKPPPERPEATEHDGLALAAVLVGGIQCELLLHRLPCPGWLGIATQDYTQARAALRLACGHELGLYFAQQLARHVLTTRWSAVAEVAGRLHEHGQIEAGEVFELLGEWRQPPAQARAT